MVNANYAVTPLTDLRPRRPINCSICGDQIGAWFQYQYSFYPYYHACTERCETLWEFSRQRQHVPAGWRRYPQDMRQLLLAAAYVEKVIQNERA